MRSHDPERTPDQPLLRRTRLKFLAWSASVTLIALLVVGGAIYTAVAKSLADSATEQLRARASEMAAKISLVQRPIFDVGVPAGVVVDPAAPGVVLGGAMSGTLGIVVDSVAAGSTDSGTAPETGGTFARQQFSTKFATTPGSEKVILSPVDPIGLAAARAGHTAVNEAYINDTPVRILSQPFETAEATYTIQVIGDRTNEERTLSVLLTVLTGGSLLVLAVALVAGYVLSGRALVPIRESMRRQRQFAADASHELRTPLTIVRTSLEHLRRHPEATVGRLGGTIDDIDAGASRLTDLVDQLLLLARTDSGGVEIERVPVDLAEIALEAVGGLSGLAATREADVRLDVEPVELEGDPARLRQLVSLLLDNALRHGPPGQVVQVRVHGRPRGGAQLDVEDQGPGIAPADLPHIFERFYRAGNAAPGGTGLGLAIVEWIVDRHGGTIRADNLPTGGARFSASLPA
jgi:two-component system sensor histidine kinase CiaH